MTSAPEDPSPPQARTASGWVRGQWEHDLAVFRGIPFAAPPVGAARFDAPVPAAAWDGVRPAVEFGPPTPQELSFMGRTGAVELPTGDDWLTVNVWTPQPDPVARRPVLVWIYGGAYKLGYAGNPGYDGRTVARDGDVVFVSFNYRVGIEGFAYLDGAPANRGLLDQIAALEWVRDNIARFGGDPDRVTVGGDSAGAGSIAALLAMPRAAGLFHRAILQSMPGMYHSPELAADVAAAIAEAAGRRPTRADLADTDPRQLPAAGVATAADAQRHADRWGHLASGISLFAPVVDGDTLPAAPWQALAAGSARDIPLIVGHNRSETRLFLALAGQLGAITEERAAWAMDAYGPGPDAAAGYRSAYPDAGPEQLFELVNSDFQFRMPALHLVEAHTAAGGRAHMYELTWPAPNNAALGACHGLETPLLFGTFASQLGPMFFGPNPSDEARALAANIRTAWTAFVRTGDPGWPAYDSPQRRVQIFDATPTVAPYPEDASRLLWRDHAFGALELRHPAGEAAR